MKEDIIKSASDSVRAMKALMSEAGLKFIEDASIAISNCFRNKGKILIAGNGGSLCESIHFAEEFTGYFREKRRAFPAMALADPGVLTCTANDAGYEYVFSRAVEAFGKAGDIFIALTTSGNSQNLIEAIIAAKKQKMKTIAFLGKTGGKTKGLSDIEWIVEGFKTSDRVQEAHLAAIHIIIEMVEKELVYSAEKLSEIKQLV